MLEYSCEEATFLLKKNLENAKASLEVLIADLQFLRDQVTITQVISLFYNITFFSKWVLVVIKGAQTCLKPF